MSFYVINPNQTFYDSTGTPRAGGFVTFFVNTTSTKGSIYSDEALTVAQNNPYELDASGRIIGDVKYSGLMTMQVTNSDGSDVRTEDNVSTVETSGTLATLAASGGSDLVGFIQSGTGAVARTEQDKSREMASIEDWLPDGFVTDGSIDYTTEIQAAIDACTLAGVGFRPLYANEGDWEISNIILPPAFVLKGAGRHLTRFRVKAGATGKVITDNGNAAKISLMDFAIYGESETGVTDLIDLGNGATQWGTEGVIERLFLRDAPNARGLDVNGNVGHVKDVSVWYTQDGIYGTGTAVNYYNCVCLGNTQYGMFVSTGYSYGCEIEAPTAACIPFYINRDHHAFGLTISQAASTTNTDLIQIDALATDWTVDGLAILQKSGSAYTNQINDLGATRGASADNKRSYTSDFPVVNNQQLINLTFRITNDAGTLKHSIGSVGGVSVAGKYIGRINGATTTSTTTPTGADASTAMAAGAKISSVSLHNIILDTLAQTDLDAVMQLSIVSNYTGTVVFVTPTFTSRDVNGVTLKRLELSFRDNAGAVFNINTTNIPASKFIDILIYGYLY